jgi:hypothetical protein
MANTPQAAEAASTKKKKQIVRSPKYPLITITEALAKARVIYQYEKKAKTTAAVILSHIGYKTQTGLAARVFSALQQYGLLERSDSQYHISDRAFKIFNLPDGDPERAALMKEAALMPVLFKELVSKYRDGLPSDATLKSYLVIHKDFNENSVEYFFKVFKAAIDLAKPFDADYTADQRSEAEMPEGEQGMESSALPNREHSRKSGGQNPLPPPRPAGGAMNAPLAPNEQDLKMNVGPERQVRIVFDGPITLEAAEMISAILNVQKRVFRKEADLNKSADTETSESA